MSLGCSILVLAALAQPAQPASIAPQLESLRPYIGKTFRGIFKNSTPEKPMIDIAKWERALNGQAVRVLHSINNGDYGGETLIYWDPAKKALSYHYFTTAGFFTHGTMRKAGKSMISLEDVVGNANGITKVRNTSRFNDDGSFTSKAEFFANGKWAPGHEITYTEAPGAEVVFR